MAQKLVDHHNRVEECYKHWKKVNPKFPCSFFMNPTIRCLDSNSKSQHAIIENLIYENLINSKAKSEIEYAEPFGVPINADKIDNVYKLWESVLPDAWCLDKKECDAKISQIKEIYHFRNPSEIDDYIYSNRSLLIDFLLTEAPLKIREFFPKAKLELELFTNPEATEYKELFICIKNDLGPKEAIKQLNKLDMEWWLDICNKYNGKLCITLN
jgi:hypothetical protein